MVVKLVPDVCTENEIRTVRWKFCTCSIRPSEVDSLLETSFAGLFLYPIEHFGLDIDSNHPASPPNRSCQGNREETRSSSKVDHDGSSFDSEALENFGGREPCQPLGIIEQVSIPEMEKAVGWHAVGFSLWIGFTELTEIIRQSLQSL